MRKVTTNLFNALARVAKAHWGLSTNALATIYEGAFIPKITYAAGVWYAAAQKVVIKKQVRSAQRMALLRLTRSFRTVSTDALLVIAGTPPIDLVLKEKANCYRWRRGLPLILDDQMESMEYETKPKATMLPKLYHRMAIMTAAEGESSEINIYTDGSKVEDRVGASFLVEKEDKIIHYEQFRLDNRCSVYQAELLALLQAVKWCASSQNLSSIIINTDSRAALQTLQQFTDTNQMALEMKTLIRVNHLQIKFRWVKAHSGIRGNERADELAKEATQLEEITYSKIPISYVKRRLRQSTVEIWQEEWSNGRNGRHTFWLLPSVEERTRELRWLTPNFYLTQLLTNHCNTKDYLKRINKVQDTLCVCGNGMHSLEHLLEECSKYEQERLQFQLQAKDVIHTSEIDLYMCLRHRDLVRELQNFTRRILS
ncbi:uncharacterized protein LOC111618865 [Centruroides sculpturatus]|uniref:uncharacterized protein LOC111618865 n=1 Tax=Centruroides sculpturatus TaxID=218467 RepID=UPI000C6EAB7E|nr:uncharacterized protein LOC111618865 [Centruroides sculpturatus]